MEITKEIKDNYYSVEEIIKITKKSKSTVYNWLKNGLKSYDFFNRKLVHKKDLEKYLNKKIEE